MNWQAVIVAIILLSAGIYTANMIWKRVKSFSAKTACGNDCGCDTKSVAKIPTKALKR